MTKRTPVSAQKNIWFDAQQVDNTDLTLEQQHNDTIQSSIVNNHLGNGVLPEVLVQNVLFDSSAVSGFVDGIALLPQNQPSDPNLGNQLEITLTGSKAASRKSVKIAILGLDFQGDLQYETFVFKANETQVSRKHFTQILIFLINDLIGNPTLSLNLGGEIVVREAHPMTLSRQPLMIAQDQQPSLFFRDFFVDGFNTFTTLLQGALPLYNIDSLNITSGSLDQKLLLNGDVTTQIGEKFLATTNNIQKVTLLLSVRNTDNSTDLIWNGDLVLSIYPLQSFVDCPTDISPSLPIDFSPSNIPVAQVSLNYVSLLNSGVELSTVPQPIDFVFSNSPVAGGNVLVEGQYYAIALKRSGAANKCDILIDVGSAVLENSRITTFTGSLWVDISEEQLWFQIWTDAAKVSDGQAYDTGHGVTIPKTKTDPDTGVVEDYSREGIQFAGNEVFRAVVSATTEKSVAVPDPRTGNPVLTRQELVPTIELHNSIDIAGLQETSEPLIIGAIADKNRKFFDSISSLITANLYSFTLVKDELVIRVIDDPTDTTRYDLLVTALQSNLLNGDLVAAKISPNANTQSIAYRIADARLCTYILGDVDGDGVVTQSDLDLLTSYYGMDLTVGAPLQTSITFPDGYETDGYHLEYTNGYLTMTQPFTNLFSAVFWLVRASDGYIVASGNDGVLVANPNNDRLSQFTSASIQFNTIVGLSDYKLVIKEVGNDADTGAFDIVSIDSISDVLTLRKVILSGDSFGEMLRADINGDFHIDNIDGYLLQSYIDRVPLTTSPTTTYPAPATNPFTKIGTTFNVIRFRLETFVDRTDDHAADLGNRGTTIHVQPDIFVADGYFASHDFLNQPVPISISKQLSWDESLVVTNSHSKLVPSAFTSQNGFLRNDCQLDGISCAIYGAQPNFDPGRNDFFVQNNLILGNGGEIWRPDGYFYKVDFEVGTIILEIPDGLFGSERTLNIFTDFISNHNGNGTTRQGFPAMRFADCSFVGSDALAKDQVRFSVSVQSFSPNTNGLSEDGYGGVVVDGKMGVAIDHATGLLTLNFTNLFEDAVLPTLNTKIQIHVFLKKGGFNNRALFINSTKVQNMLSLISVFSGANEGGPSALVDLEADVTGILPILHGGTGLNAVGPFGTVLTSNGSGLSYQFVNTLLNVISFSLGSVHADRVPKTDGYGFLDPSFLYKQPVYIAAVAGTHSHDGYTPAAIGAFTFRFDSFILEGLSTIKLECILETTNVAATAGIQLFNVNTHTYLNLTGPSAALTTNSIQATFLASQDIKSQMSTGATNFVYEVHLNISPGGGIDTAICKMARLVMTYNNLTLNGSSEIAPPLAHSYNFVPYLPSPTPS
jgi:hypothetical protein